MTPIVFQPYAAPCGKMMLGSYEDRLCLCDWAGDSQRESLDASLGKKLRAPYVAGTTPVLARAAAQLDEYFARARRVFDIPLLFCGTPFQRLVWQALLAIPYGATLSYAALAQRIGRPTAVRAVANANRRNLLAVVAPCHRVIGSTGALVGYGGGLPIKQFLLHLEGAWPLAKAES